MSDKPQSIEDLSPEQRKELEEKLKNMSPEEIADLQKQQCIFCKIVEGKVPSKKVYEDDVSIVILDIQPATKGHLLLIPKEHYAIMPQVPDDILQKLFTTAKRLSQAILRGLKVGGTSLYIANGQAAGQRALHFMIHMIPRKDGDKIIDDLEKLIDRPMQEKVKLAVQDKVLSLMGVEKQTTLEEVEPEPEPEEEEPESDEDMGTEEQPDEDQEEEPERQGAEKDEDVSLDDIANLFK